MKFVAAQSLQIKNQNKQRYRNANAYWWRVEAGAFGSSIWPIRRNAILLLPGFAVHESVVLTASGNKLDGATRAITE